MYVGVYFWSGLGKNRGGGGDITLTNVIVLDMDESSKSV